MLKLISTDAIPESLFITDVETDFEPIAVGGFGRVFRGEYKGQKVALKMLDKCHRRKGSLAQDFCREALAWRSLSHRFILPLLGIFENKSQLYLVSSFMMNGTLSNWRKEQTPTMSELHRMMLEVTEGILYIHSEGIVHGDLHGGNILLDSDLHCQISDFGSTRHSEATVTQSTTALSLAFAAPELFGMCIKCGHKTMKTDVYAFGCLYYSTFFDTVPFHGTNDFKIIRLLMKGKRPRRLESPRMADNTWNLIQRCWESIPSKRPTMEQIVDMLTV
ncbi:kinase-like domain-containing protein [Amanita rubescens]|nr:kinase-like domain-containing protein [Amanita rubescens]